MDDQPGLSDQYRTSSPWPPIVVCGLVFSELGLFFNVFSVAVGGLLLFVASIAGAVLESGYADSPWNLVASLGVVLLVLGAVLTATQVSAVSTDTLWTLVRDPNSIVSRGWALAVAGLVALVGGVCGRYVAREPF